MNIDRKKIQIFLCALWPGGGYMYFGMMKKGTMVMALFTDVYKRQISAPAEACSKSLFLHLA